MAELGMDETSVVGTGKDGRVTKKDVERAWEAQGTDLGEDEKAIEQATRRVAPPAGTPYTPSGSTGQQTVYGATNRTENRVPMSRLRARVAERLIQSQQQTASLTTFNEVNMQPVLDLRRKFGEQFEREHGVRLGLMSFFVKAAIAALKRFPVVNASIDGNDIVYHGYYDIGIAISSPRGLVVPIMRDADLMTIAEIEKKINELSIKARGRPVDAGRPDGWDVLDFQWGCFRFAAVDADHQSTAGSHFGYPCHDGTAWSSKTARS